MLTADLNLTHKGTPTLIKVKAVGADTFYKGALVYADAANGKAQAVPAAGDTLIGICAYQVVAGAADVLIPIYVDGVWSLPYNSAAEGDQDASIIMDISAHQTDDIGDCDAAAVATLDTGDILIGKMIAMDYEETSNGWVILTPGWTWEDTEKAWL